MLLIQCDIAIAINELQQYKFLGSSPESPIELHASNQPFKRSTKRPRAPTAGLTVENTGYASGADS